MMSQSLEYCKMCMRHRPVVEDPFHCENCNLFICEGCKEALSEANMEKCPYCKGWLVKPKEYFEPEIPHEELVAEAEQFNREYDLDLARRRVITALKYHQAVGRQGTRHANTRRVAPVTLEVRPDESRRSSVEIRRGNMEELANRQRLIEWEEMEDVDTISWRDRPALLRRPVGSAILEFLKDQAAANNVIHAHVERELQQPINKGLVWSVLQKMVSQGMLSKKVAHDNTIYYGPP